MSQTYARQFATIISGTNISTPGFSVGGARHTALAIPAGASLQLFIEGSYDSDIRSASNWFRMWDAASVGSGQVVFNAASAAIAVNVGPLIGAARQFRLSSGAFNVTSPVSAVAMQSWYR